MIGRLLFSRKISKKEDLSTYKNSRNLTVLFFGFLYIIGLVFLLTYLENFPLNDLITLIALLSVEWIIKLTVFILNRFKL